MKKLDEVIIKSLTIRGLNLKKKRGKCYAFLYEDFEVICTFKKSDKHCLMCRFMVPRIAKVPMRGIPQYLEMVNDMNMGMTGAKFFIYHRSVWSMHECCLFEDEHLEGRIEYTLSVLKASVHLARIKSDAMFIP